MKCKRNMKNIYLLCTLIFLLISTFVTAQFTKLVDFAGATNGKNPAGSLISDGTFLYGMTLYGGTNNFGTIFKIMPDGTGFVKLFDFAGTTSGSNPFGSLIYDGTFLYGMTYQGGTNNLGTIFKIMPDGTGYLKLLDFAGTTNGNNPTSSLFYDGTYLYGMTPLGGTVNGGTLFKIMPNGTGYVKLLDFTAAPVGNLPSGALISDGTFLYGMTTYGGTNNIGAVFKIMPDGTGYTNILDFAGATNGRNPHYGSLFYDGTFLYGMTEAGGIYDYGTVFKIMPDGTGYAKLRDFLGGVLNERLPWGSLNSDGTFLYGMTTAGGLNNIGTIFKIMPNGTGYTKLWDFEETTSGNHPEGDLITDSTFLYGMTYDGGINSFGVLFKFQFTPLSIDELSIKNNELSVYPNPASYNFTININAMMGNAQIEIYNVFGAKVYRSVLKNKQEMINTKQFSAGIYFVKVFDEEKMFTRKIVVE